MSPQPDHATLPRLLAGMPAHGAVGLQEHLAMHGQAPFAGRRERRRADTLIELAEQAGLLGRGGGAFPTAAKMRAVLSARGRPIILVNAAEGDPTSFKDRTLLEGLPHLVLDGGVLAAWALGADELILCVNESAGPALPSALRAIRERERAGGDGLKVHLQVVPDTYLAGQESALVNHLNGGPPKPTFTPPMPFQRGVCQRPTMVGNVETFAHLALIARYGPEWFRQLGTSTHSGSTLVTLSGAVAYPGVYEIEHGAPLRSLIQAAGGASAPTRAVLLGGYAGRFLDGRLLSSLSLSNEHLAPHQATLGAGVVVLLSDETCPVAETVRVARWLAEQSSGQCGPCVHGLDSIAAALEELAAGIAPAGTGTRIARWASLARGRGACQHPDGTVGFIDSALNTFAAEFGDHARHGPCAACAAPRELPLPASIGLARRVSA